MVGESFVRRWKWLFLVSVFAGWLLPLGVDDLRAGRADQVDKDLQQKKKDLKEIKKEISLTKDKEKKIEGTESSILGSLQALEVELYKKGKELKQMEVHLGKTQGRLHQTRQQITGLNKEMEQTREALHSRLTALYKMGRIPPETLLLTSQSYPDLLRMDKYLRVIIDSDARLIDTHRHQMSLKEGYQAELMEDRIQRERSVSEMGKKRDEIKRVRGKKRTLLKSIQNQKVVYQKVILELEERAKELQTLINRLGQDKRVIAHGGSRYEGFKGRLIPPVQGRVVSLFKEKGQNGIEIKAPMDAEVRAVLPGKVIYADWFKGFGNMVIIDHGDHTFTVSAYCSQLLKKEGDVVSQGEPIALVGTAGSLRGPSLYFEIRHRGKPQDPMLWISNLDKVVSLPEQDQKGR
jgi:septal ring factor EnvC (AmiA/AmiB activator)